MPIDRHFDNCLGYNPAPSDFNLTSPGRWLPGSDWSNGWPFAAYSGTMYNHVAPPNWSGYDCGSFSAFPDTPGEHAIIAARSEHPGTVNVIFADGHGETVSDSTDIILWRSLGSRDGAEVLPDNL